MICCLIIRVQHLMSRLGVHHRLESYGKQNVDIKWRRVKVSLSIDFRAMHQISRSIKKRCSVRVQLV